MARWWTISAVALTALLLAACSDGPTAHASKRVKDAKAAPNFTLTDAGGRHVSLSDFRGKVVVLNFWATWCGPCQIEIPWFVQFEQQFRSKGLEIVGVSMDEDGWPAVKPFVRERHINYTILLGNESVAQLYGGLDALPTTFILDRKGRIAFPAHVGLAAKSEYLHEIESLLGSNRTSASLFHLRPDLAVALAGAAK
ncbi:MAG: peroxiredoxin family protein [Bryobacteraceae bacterium]